MIDNYESGGVPYGQHDVMLKCPECGSIYVGSCAHDHSHACETEMEEHNDE